MSRPIGTYNSTDDPPPADPEYDCQGEGGPDCRCHICLNDCCPNCKSLLLTRRAGDESYRYCPECEYKEY